MHVVTPHEFFMALLPDQFPWESRVLTDFRELLPKLKTTKQELKDLEENKVQDEMSMALV